MNLARNRAVVAQFDELSNSGGDLVLLRTDRMIRVQPAWTGGEPERHFL